MKRSKELNKYIGTIDMEAVKKYGIKMTNKGRCPRWMQRDPFVKGCIPNVEGWKLDKQQSRKHSYEFNNKHINVTLYIRKPLHGDTWNVSILGGRRAQREYLAGGNSTIHDASRGMAMDIAKSYMILHPKGTRRG